MCAINLNRYPKWWGLSLPLSLVKIVQHIRESASLSSSSVIECRKSTADVNSLAQQEVTQRKNVEALKRQVETASADERSS
jgi:hypothetical protein